MPHPPTQTARALERDPDRLTSGVFDLVVVGGGIYGVWAAMDAAQRGLKVALLEQDDFGSGVSANSQRVVHGGLRYLQHGDLKRMRESIRERSNLLRVASHLVQPMPFIVPTYGLGLRGRPAMFAAMKLNDLISADRNRGLPASRRLPNGRLISRDRCLQLAPGIDPDGLTGGAIFYDAQVNHSERLALSVVRRAVDAGAQAANHMRVTAMIREGKRITGVKAQDLLTGQTLEVRAHLTLCCAGPWTARTTAMASAAQEPPRARRFQTLRAVVLVTRAMFDGIGLAVPSRKTFKDNKELVGKGFRNLFVTPWRGLSLVGTFYTEYQGDPDDLSVSAQELGGFVNEFNRAYPDAGLTLDDVRFTFMGLLPKAQTKPSRDEPVCEKHYRLVDHNQTEGIDGLVTVFGVKWTTARDVAQRAIDLAARKLGHKTPACRTADTPLHGTPMADPADAADEALANRPPWADRPLITHLFDAYGLAYRAVLDLAQAQPRLREPVSDNSPTILAQMAYAARFEMARTLRDVIFRRTDLGLRGWPGTDALQRCAQAMAQELGWDGRETHAQIQKVRQTYRQRGLTTTP